MPDPHFPKHPIYVVSKGRSKFMMTSIALTEMRVPHFIVVEPQEVDQYRAAIAARGLSVTILPLDMRFKQTYELCDNLGHSRSTGSGPARNFAWEHSIASGAEWLWIADDNVGEFFRLNRNRKIKCVSPAIFRAMEDLCERYANVAMAGPNYDFFVPQRQKMPPVYLNTRIYSCNLIRNNVPFRWRGRYNEDVIMSLDMLKAGWCTIEFNAFLQGKVPTLTMSGGNTDELYRDGTTAKAQMLARVHPDVARVTWKFGRVHHQVDYRPFRTTRLILRKGFVMPTEPNEFGMTLKSP